MLIITFYSSVIHIIKIIIIIIKIEIKSIIPKFEECLHKMDCIIDQQYVITNPHCLQYVKNISNELLNKIIDINPINLQYIPDEYLTYDLIKKSVENDKKCQIIKSINDQNEELQYIFLKNFQNENVLFSTFENIKNPSYDICKLAIEMKPDVILLDNIKNNFPCLRLHGLKLNFNLMHKLNYLTDDEKNYIFDKDFRYIIFFKDTTIDDIENIARNNIKWFFNYALGYHITNDKMRIVASKINIIYFWKYGHYFSKNIVKEIIKNNPNIEQYLDNFCDFVGYSGFRFDNSYKNWRCQNFNLYKNLLEEYYEYYK